jgi:hypothetical protein
MMKKKIWIGSVFAALLLLSMPFVSAVQVENIEATPSPVVLPDDDPYSKDRCYARLLNLTKYTGVMAEIIGKMIVNRLKQGRLRAAILIAITIGGISYSSFMLWFGECGHHWWGDGEMENKTISSSPISKKTAPISSTPLVPSNGAISSKPLVPKNGVARMIKNIFVKLSSSSALVSPSTPVSATTEKCPCEEISNSAPQTL